MASTNPKKTKSEAETQAQTAKDAMKISYISSNSLYDEQHSMESLIQSLRIPVVRRDQRLTDKLFLMNIDSLEVEENATSMGQQLKEQRGRTVDTSENKDGMEQEMESIIHKLNQTINAIQVYTGQNFTFESVSELTRNRNMFKYPLRNSIRPIRYWCDKMVYYKGQIIGILRRKKINL